MNQVRWLNKDQGEALKVGKFPLGKAEKVNQESRSVFQRLS